MARTYRQDANTITKRSEADALRRMNHPNAEIAEQEAQLMRRHYEACEETGSGASWAFITIGLVITAIFALCVVQNSGIDVLSMFTAFGW